MTASTQHHRRTIRRMHAAKCSPKVRDKVTGFSCYTFDDLGYLRKLWNASAPPTKQIPSAASPREIHQQLAAHNGPNEAQWLRQSWVKNSVASQIRGFAFAPKAPTVWDKNPNEWLSSTEIEDVMRQYQSAYKCFQFIGPSPIDFDTRVDGRAVWPELANFSVADLLRKGKSKIGIILNTDTHDKSGQHWISMFVNLKKGAIYFFDSVGDKAPPQVMALVKRITDQGSALPHQVAFTFDQNWPVEHQYGNTECGIYSLYFVVHMLEDKLTGHYLKTHVLRDKYMQRFRHVYFNSGGAL